jgi:hypothetical protein
MHAVKQSDRSFAKRLSGRKSGRCCVQGCAVQGVASERKISAAEEAIRLKKNLS